jgi:hypothetical protein
VHHLVAAQNGIGRAGLDAQGAANAPCFIDDGHSHRPFKAMFKVQWLDGLASEARQNGHAFGATWRTLIDGGLF